MIEEKDLPFLILIEEKLIELKNDSFLISYGNFKEDFKDKSHFNNIVRILIEYGLAKEPNNPFPNNIAVSKTDKTGYNRIQDIFDKEQNILKSKSVESENIQLTNESLKYQQTIRDQDQRIKNLNEENLKLQNINLKRTFFIILVTAILSNSIDILEYIKSLFQSNTHLKQEVKRQTLNDTTIQVNQAKNQTDTTK